MGRIKGTLREGADLSDQQREKLVWLRDSYGLSFEAIGERYGLTPGTAAALYRATKAGRATRRPRAGLYREATG